MTTGPTFIPNSGFDEELLASDELDPALLTVAESAAKAARGVAPVDTGKYRDSIQVVIGNEGGIRTARVLSDDEKAVWIERGTGAPGPTKAYHPLQTGIERARG